MVDERTTLHILASNMELDRFRMVIEKSIKYCSWIAEILCLTKQRRKVKLKHLQIPQLGIFQDGSLGLHLSSVANILFCGDLLVGHLLNLS